MRLSSTMKGESKVDIEHEHIIPKSGSIYGLTVISI